MAPVLFTFNNNDRQIISINANIIRRSICRYITIRIYIKYITRELKIGGKYRKFYGFPYLDNTQLTASIIPNLFIAPEVRHDKTSYSETALVSSVTCVRADLAHSQTSKIFLTVSTIQLSR